MERKAIDCREFPGATCSVKIEGTEDEVMKLASRHAVEEHGHEDGPELRENLKGMIKDA